MVDEKLAETVRKFPILYDKSSKDFKVKHKKKRMGGCGEGSFLIGLDFRTGSTFEQAGLYVFNVCRISCLDILITNGDSGLRRKCSGIRFLCKNGHKNTLYACVYTYAYVTAVLTSA